MIYLITYDINTVVKNYDEMYDAIKGISYDYQHPLESVWLVNTRYDIKQVYSIVRAKMDVKDYLLITEIKGNYYGWLNKNVWEWLQLKLRH